MSHVNFKHLLQYFVCGEHFIFNLDISIFHAQHWIQNVNHNINSKNILRENFSYQALSYQIFQPWCSEGVPGHHRGVVPGGGHQLDHGCLAGGE